MDEKELRVVQVETGKAIRVLKGHEFDVYAVTYSPDGRHILSGDGNCLRLWDVQTGNQLLRLEGRNGRLSCLVITPDGRFAVSGHSAGSGVELIPPRDLFLWDLKTGKVVCRDRIILRRWIAQHFFSGYYDLLPEKTRQQLPRIVLDPFEGATCREVCRFEGQKEVNCVAISPDGKSVLCSCADGRARVLEIATGNETCCLGRRGSQGAWSVAFSPDGERVLVGTEGGEVHLWYIAEKSELRTLGGHKGAVYTVAFSPDGKRALSGGRDGTVRLWNLEAGKELACFRELKGPITSVAFSPDGKRAVYGDESVHIRHWKLPE